MRTFFWVDARLLASQKILPTKQIKDYLHIHPVINPTMAQQPPQWAMASSLSTLHDLSQAHHARWDSSGRVISSKQRPLPDNTQHSQQTNKHSAGGIRTRNSNKRAAPCCVATTIPAINNDQITPRRRLILEKLIVPHLVKKLPVFNL